MSRSASRLLATTTSQLSSLSHRTPTGLQAVRHFSQTCRQQDGPERPISLLWGLNRNRQSSAPAPPPRDSGMSDLDRILAKDLVMDTMVRSRNQAAYNDFDAEGADQGPPSEPYHLHFYSHKHNSHITVTRPDRGPIISLSAGNIGFKKAKRGTYDAAYQLTAYALDKLNQMGMHREINELEVVLRGFGTGREAAVKVLLGNEGRLLRDKIIKVSDSTRIKFGGTRSPKPRRLG
ncbi:translational machinery component [Biscogniauxia marginata]|nr:translational machinery component [Biscogniauxia marginata]